MTTKIRSKNGALQTITLAGERFVVVPESKYRELCEAAMRDTPALPEPDEKGNYPAAEALQVSIAHSIRRGRLRLGITQERLARLAGIRPETLKRIEQGKHSPSVRTVEKLEQALKQAKSR